MPDAESISLCPICGNHVPPSRGSVTRKFCSEKCNDVASGRAQAERRRIAADESRPMVPCPVCGTEFKKKYKREYCSDSCREKNRNNKEKRQEYIKQYREINSEKHKLHSSEYMRNRRAIDDDFKKRQLIAKKRWKAANPDKVARHRAKERIRRSKYDAHVRAWLAHLSHQQEKHDSHVASFKAYMRSASTCVLARFYKAIGQPWKNPRFSAALQYKIQYRLDLEFRLSEINRLGWRKETLSARDDGTVNFWELLRERKTCPYCGKPITKENAVADHMDPIKRGGANGQHNLTICCRECNQKKGAKPYLAWVATLPEHRQKPALLWYKRKHGHGPEQQSLCFVFNAA